MSRFPRAGTPNAKSDVKLATFHVDSKGNITNVRILQLSQTLSVLFPAAEYLVRAGWTPQGEQLGTFIYSAFEFVLNYFLFSMRIKCLAANGRSQSGETRFGPDSAAPFPLRASKRSTNR